MKKIFYIAVLTLLASCQQKVQFDRNFYVTFADGNSYVAGEPVKFSLNGSVGNVLFYSGEAGCEYEHRDRYHLTEDEIESVTLQLDIQARYNGGVYTGGLDLYVTDGFDGLAWDDGEQDRNTVSSMLEGGMQGWEKLEYAPGESGAWTECLYDVTEYADNFVLAVHWRPEIGSWGKYMINGDIVVKPKDGLPELEYDIKDIGLNVLNMPSNYEPYGARSGNGNISFSSADGELAFMGSSSLTHQVDSWLFSVAGPVCRKDGDRGIVVKNLRDDISSFEYTWQAPGLYKVVFVSVDYAVGESRKVISEFNVNIVEPIN